MKRSKLILVIAVIFFVTVSMNAQEVNSATNEQLKKSTQKFIATYYGGTANDYAWGIALDDSGNVYMSGYTSSTDIPLKEGSYISPSKGKADVLVLKLDKDLTKIIASALIGGSENDASYTILYDKGYVYIAGYTGSKDFPVTAYSYCTTYKGGRGDAFIVKMDSELKSIVASTYLGGSGDEDDWFNPEIILDEKRNIYITGITSSLFH